MAAGESTTLIWHEPWTVIRSEPATNRNVAELNRSPLQAAGELPRTTRPRFRAFVARENRNPLGNVIVTAVTGSAVVASAVIASRGRPRPIPENFAAVTRGWRGGAGAGAGAGRAVIAAVSGDAA